MRGSRLLVWLLAPAALGAQDVARDAAPLLQPAGLFGLLSPTYDRVNGLSLPVGAVLTLGDSALVVEPSATYRSRLGVVDPAVGVTVLRGRPLRVEGRVARETRTNDDWIYSDFVNSVTTFFSGADTRNYFRSDVGEGRIVRADAWRSDTLETYVGARHERILPITAAGTVWSVTGRSSAEQMLRRNPVVEQGELTSALVGAELRSAAGVVRSRLRASAEQGLRSPAGTSRFLQLTVDGGVEFPTFGAQQLHVSAHGLATLGDTVPMARYAYLGGSGTLRTLDPLEQGGTALFFLENRYTIPIDLVQLPLVGAPVLTLRDAFGSAGIGSLPSFQHEIGVGLGLSTIRIDLTTAVAGRSGTEVGVGISLSR